MDFTPDFELSGYAELRAAYMFHAPPPESYGVDPVEWNLYERVRPGFKIEPSERVTAEAVVEASLAQGRDSVGEAIALLEGSELGDILAGSSCTYTEEARYAEASDYLSVERLHVDFNLPTMDISVGRQALRWGSGLYFHPTDVYSEVLLTEPWREPRGVNAAKVNVPIGRSNVVAAVAIDDDLSGLYPGKDGVGGGIPLSGALRGTLRAGATDLTAVSIVGPDGEWFAGWDARGTLGVGWWIEGGWHGDTRTIENVVGVDYSFPVLQMLYLGAEYRYDGSGSAPDDYAVIDRLGGGGVSVSCAGGDEAGSDYTITPDITQVDPDAEPRTTLGKHYVAGVVRLTVDNNVSVTTSAIVNLADTTGVLVPDVQLNVGRRIAWHVGAQVPFGKEGEFRPGLADTSVSVVGPGVNAAADLSSLVPTATVQSWLRYSF